MTSRKPHVLVGATLGLAVTVACEGGREAAPAGAAEAGMLAVAESLYWASEYDSARTLWSAGLERARVQRDDVTQATVLNWLTRLAYRQGDYVQGRRAGDQALAIGLRLNDPDLLTDTYNTLGLIAWAEKRLTESRELFRRSLDTAARADRADAHGRAEGNLGLVLADLGDVENARESFLSLLRAGQDGGNARYEANALTNLAMLDIWMGEARTALPRLDSARQIYREIEYAVGEQIALGHQAMAWVELDQPGRALAALDSSLATARQLGLRDEVAELLRLIAGVHRDIGDLPRALRFYDEAATLAGELDWDSELGTIRRGSALIRLELGDVTQARADAESALAAHRSAGEAFEVFDDMRVLAAIEQRAGGSGAAGAALDSVRHMAQRLGTRGARLSAALTLAAAAERADDPQATLAALDDVEDDLGAGRTSAVWQAHALAARALMKLGQLDSAIVMGNAAIEAIERQRASIRSDALEVALIADRSRVYGDLAIALLRRGRIDAAFAVADRARSRALIEYLSATRPDLRAMLPAPELAEADALLRRIDLLLEQIALLERDASTERGGGGTASMAELTASLADARGRYERIVLRATQREPVRMAVLGAGPLRTDSIQQQLGADEALLEYLVAPGAVILFVLRRTGLQAVEVPADVQDLASRVRLVRDVWGRRDGAWRESLEAARALYDILLAPAVTAGLLRDADRLVIVPHGPLASLPFAALQDRATGAFVAERRTLTYAPVAAALPALRRRTAVDSMRYRIFALAPFTSDLPGSRAELQAIGAAFPDARLFGDGDATEAVLRQALATTGIVHVATHGILNARQPLFSRLELFPTTGIVSHADDGRLEAHEVTGLAVRSPLVYLSGCETGVGNEWATDPRMGSHQSTLAQAFLYAGAHNVIATFWRIDDEGAAAFAASFYRHLTDRPPPAALAAAQRELMRDTRFSSPFYWAGYALNGSGR